MSIFNRNFYTKVNNENEYFKLLEIVKKNKVRLRPGQHIFNPNIPFIKYYKPYAQFSARITRVSNPLPSDRFIPLKDIVDIEYEEDPIPEEQRYFIGAA